jgi:carbon monoxide dehydrogenase subunit G
MEFDNSFSVQKPIDEVWSTMLDLERVVPCVPGAKVLAKTGDNSVSGAETHRSRCDRVFVE